MNEEFAITLKTILDQSSVSEVKKQLSDLKKNVGEQMAEATSPAKKVSGVFDVSGVQDHEAEIAMLLDKLDTLRQEYDVLATAKPWAGQNEELLKLAYEIEQIENRIRRLTGTGQGSVSMLSQTVVMVRNNMKGVKKQIFSIVGALIGARSVYFGIRKAMSAWLAQNSELQEKLNACWYALGSLFAPVLEWIVNKFVYLVSLVDALVKSLGFAGVNMKNYGKAGAKASKQLAGFDEINNINSQSGGGGSSGAKLNDVSDEELNRFRTILALVTAIGAGLRAWMLAEQFRTALGWTHEACAGLGLVVGGLVLAFMSLINYLNDPSWANFGLMVAGIGAVISGLGMMIGSTPMIVAGVVTAILGILSIFWPQVSAGIDAIVHYIDAHMNGLKEWLTYWFGDVGTIVGVFIETAWELIKGLLTTAQNALTSLFNGTKQIVDGIIQICRGDLAGGLANIIQGIVSVAKSALEVIFGTIRSVLTSVWNLVGSILDKIGGTVSSKIKSIINKYIVNPLNRLIGFINSCLNFSFGGLNIAGKEIVAPFSVKLGNLRAIPSLDVGTNFVPNDMLAMLHEGEAVVPKSFNEDRFDNSEETNDLLRELINVVGSKEFRAYISQREVGEASVKYINQQSRIMGGSIV